MSAERLPAVGAAGAPSTADHGPGGGEPPTARRAARHGRGSARSSLRLRLVRLALVLVAPASTGSASGQIVHPSGNRVAANLLRISVEFERPQGAAVSADLSLTTADGRPLAGSIYPQALWSPDRRTLTVYLDPGRVKTGLASRDEAGPAIEPGSTVQVRLAGRVLRTWRVVAARRLPPRVASAAVHPPAAGTRDAVTIRFSSPIDWQARDLVAIEAPDGHPAAGVPALAQAERLWRFVPDQPWRPGPYAVRLHPDLEDAQGNRMGEAFERRAGDAEASRADARLAFVVDVPAEARAAAGAGEIPPVRSRAGDGGRDATVRR